MTISIGADHGGVVLKDALKHEIALMGHSVIDRGTQGTASVDYPDFAERVGHDIQSGAADFGVLVCTTGIGISISANKMPGIRAALVYNEDGARYSRLHNNANVICFGAKYHTPYWAAQLTKLFLSTDYERGRHQPRLEKLEHLLHSSVSKSSNSLPNDA